MGNNLDALTTVFTEFYYWITLPLMFLIHVGFCMYEVGASRRRNHMHTLMKNSMIIPLVTVTFYYFGWWLYWAFPNGPFITGGIDFAAGEANTAVSLQWGQILVIELQGCSWQLSFYFLGLRHPLFLDL